LTAAKVQVGYNKSSYIPIAMCTETLPDAKRDLGWMSLQDSLIVRIAVK
jgi:hypothetical protein